VPCRPQGQQWWDKPVHHCAENSSCAATVTHFVCLVPRHNPIVQLSLEEKKNELTPRISMPDFLQLRPWATVLDVRDEEEYVRE